MIENRSFDRTSIKLLTYGGSKAGYEGWVWPEAFPSASVELALNLEFKLKSTRTHTHNHSVKSLPDELKHAMNYPSSNTLYVQSFRAWWAVAGLPMEKEFRTVVVLNYEYAELKGTPPLTKMSLSKALQKCGIPKRWRYLRKDEEDYERRIGFGEQRPRVLMIGMGLRPILPKD